MKAAICSKLLNNGHCAIKESWSGVNPICPAVSTYIGNIESINYKLMNDMACCDAWCPTKQGEE